jgi:hypothetical protein
MTRFLSIDPGIEFGWAFWNGGRAPAATGVFHPEAHEDYFVRAASTAKYFGQLISIHAPIECVYCEWPSHMEGERGGVTARGGSLVKLAYIVGVMAEASRQRRVPFVPVPVIQWKGQLSKENIQHHIRRILGERSCLPFKSHAWDAVGIGLWARGMF